MTNLLATLPLALLLHCSLFGESAVAGCPQHAGESVALRFLAGEDNEDCSNPAGSANGKFAVYMARRNAGAESLVVLALDGDMSSQELTLSALEEDLLASMGLEDVSVRNRWLPRISNDGRRVAYLAAFAEQGVLDSLAFLFDRDTGTLACVSRTNSEGLPLSAAQVTFSPLGGRLGLICRGPFLKRSHRTSPGDAYLIKEGSLMPLQLPDSGKNVQNASSLFLARGSVAFVTTDSLCPEDANENPDAYLVNEGARSVTMLRSNGPGEAIAVSVSEDGKLVAWCVVDERGSPSIWTGLIDSVGRVLEGRRIPTEREGILQVWPCVVGDGVCFVQIDPGIGIGQGSSLVLWQPAGEKFSIVARCIDNGVLGAPNASGNVSVLFSALCDLADMPKSGSFSRAKIYSADLSNKFPGEPSGH